MVSRRLSRSRLECNHKGEVFILILFVYCFWLSHPISSEVAHALAQTANILAGHALMQASRAASEQTPAFATGACFFCIFSKSISGIFSFFGVWFLRFWVVDPLFFCPKLFRFCFRLLPCPPFLLLFCLRLLPCCLLPLLRLLPCCLLPLLRLFPFLLFCFLFEPLLLLLLGLIRTI